MAANWKMFKTAAETSTFFEKFLPLVRDSAHADIVICPTLLSVPAAVETARGSRVEIGGQNLHWLREGAYTGEVSAAMLAAAGCRWVIVGHSERRQYFGETDAGVAQKTAAALEAGLRPIVCVGERLEDREAGRTEQVLETMFGGGIAALAEEQFAAITIAYEPIWAIGTGKVATPEIAAEAHRLLRRLARERYGDAAASSVRILYGGSVKPDNIRGLMAQPEIDGALVGGASLEAVSFASLVNF